MNGYGDLLFRFVVEHGNGIAVWIFIKAFHNAFGPYRVNPRREFFEIEPEQAIGLLDLMKLEDMAPAMRKNQKKKSNSSPRLKRCLII